MADRNSPTQGGDDAPCHVAIIMDGNGRWAAQRGLPRAKATGSALRRCGARCARPANLEYSFSPFSRSAWRIGRVRQQEIRDLMGLLRRFIRHDLAELHGNNVRVRIIGVRAGLESEILRLLEEAEELTKSNTGLTLVVAFNYGGRQEIAGAARRLAEDVAAGHLTAADINAELFSARLDTAGIPDPDLIIRTSGEQRLSNFLLWQAAYSELVFVPVYWPEFDRAALEEAIAEFRRRERRFGGLVARTGS